MRSGKRTVRTLKTTAKVTSVGLAGLTILGWLLLRPSPGTVRVTEVVDGDTIKVQINGSIEKVRLIGVDTPETVDRSSPIGCFGPEATAFTKLSLEEHEVRLEFDVERRDRYGRLLAYLFLGKDLFNEELVAEGYAVVATYPPNVRYVDRFLEAQRIAKKAGMGRWAACASPSPTEPQPTKPPTASSPPGPDCDPSYPGVCIPPVSVAGNLTCGDIDYRRFKVLPPDPHGFDGSDDDGIGCES